MFARHAGGSSGQLCVAGAAGLFWWVMTRHCLKISILAMILAVQAQTALASRNPQPPPSGIVVHLFGPDSVLGNMAPATPARPVSSVAGAVPTGAAHDGAVVSAPGGSVAADPSDPSIHDILRQMFVTGNPDQKPGAMLATGRAADRP